MLKCRHMYKYVISLARLIGGMLLVGVALLGFSVVCLLLILFYLLYRFLWLFSNEASKQHMEQKFKRRKEKLLHYELNKRSKFSTSIDQENICSLIKLTNQEISSRKEYLDSFVLSETQYLLNRCRHDQDFNQALRIHDIVVQTDDVLLNQKLANLIDELSSFH